MRLGVVVMFSDFDETCTDEAYRYASYIPPLSFINIEEPTPNRMELFIKNSKQVSIYQFNRNSIFYRVQISHILENSNKTFSNQRNSTIIS